MVGTKVRIEWKLFKKLVMSLYLFPYSIQFSQMKRKTPKEVRKKACGYLCGYLGMSILSRGNGNIQKSEIGGVALACVRNRK